MAPVKCSSLLDSYSGRILESFGERAGRQIQHRRSREPPQQTLVLAAMSPGKGDTCFGDRQSRKTTGVEPSGFENPMQFSPPSRYTFETDLGTLTFAAVLHPRSSPRGVLAMRMTSRCR